MRGCIGGMLVGLVALALLPASAGAATTNTNIGSFADTRGDLPSHPGQLVRSTYSSFTVPANGQLHNVPMAVTPPCTNCRITDMVPNLVFTNGSTANMQDGLMLHHFVLFNPAQTGIGCPISEPFFGAGNERTHLHLPSPYGYHNTSASWNMITHLVNQTATAQTVNIEVVYRWRPVAETESARPAWLDIDSICSGGNSEYTIPTGYSDTHVDWTVPQNARIIAMSGHLHDIDIIDPSPCSVHCASRGEAIALSAELLGGPSGDYFGPIPPNNPPPGDITGATLCRSEGHHGSSVATTMRANGHLDTMSTCGINSEVPVGAQAEAYPPDGAYSFEGYPVKAGQVIRLHSEYQNNSGAPKTDVMGIMAPWLAFPDPGYPRPKSASPVQVPLVPAYNQCTSPNRTHGPPLASGSCSPPQQSSGQLTVGTPDANGQGPNSVARVWLRVQAGIPSTPADEADIGLSGSITDVRVASDLSDYTGPLEARVTLRITDKDSTPHPGGPGAATTEDIPWSFPIPCAATAAVTIGAHCTFDTTAEAFVPGIAKEGRRAIWELGQLAVHDGSGGVFMRQGIFVP